MSIRTCPLIVLAAGIAAVLGAALLLSACGGGSADEQAFSPGLSSQAALSAPPSMAAEPLFDEYGHARLTPVHLTPANPAARTRNGLYVTRDEYQLQEVMAGPYTVLIDLDALAGVEDALKAAARVRDQRGMSYFVRGRDRIRAARTVDVLVGAGYSPVFLIV